MPRDPQLPLFEEPPDSPNVEFLERLLLERRGWMTAAQISAAVEGRWDDRQIRALASSSKWIISGQKGYKHLKHATASEADHCFNGWSSQARMMWLRSIRGRHLFHSIAG